MAAADLALADAGLRTDDEYPPFGVGVVTAAGSGGGEFGQRELQRLWGQGPRFVGPYQSIAWFYAASTGQISIRGGFKGPCGVVASDEAGGLDAIATRRGQHPAGHRRRGGRRRRGAARPLLGGLPAGLRRAEPGRRPGGAYLPFTASACGFVPAEGGAMLVVEDAEHARRRGARIRATVAGHAATFTGASQLGAVPRGAGPGDPRRAGRGAAAHRTTSTSSSPTRWAPSTPTGPRRWRWPTRSARTRPAFR